LEQEITNKGVITYENNKEKIMTTITYPFVLNNGTVCYLYLPPKITIEEADRMKQFILSLVTVKEL